jgi:hypothetical protein
MSREPLTDTDRVRNRHRLRAVVNARDNLRAARRGYHLEIMIAHGDNYTPEEIAAALETPPHYIANVIRNHLHNDCGCGA